MIRWLDLSDPFLMKGMQAAVDRIILALQKKNPGYLRGYDVDGITATSILVPFSEKGRGGCPILYSCQRNGRIWTESACGTEAGRRGV